MKLIKTEKKPADCRECRHYFFRPDERLSYGCLAMDYIGKHPASKTVLNPEEWPCHLFTPITSSQSWP